LKPIYKATTEEAALFKLDRFKEIWGMKYPAHHPVKNWDGAGDLFQVLAGDPQDHPHNQYHPNSPSTARNVMTSQDALIWPRWTWFVNGQAVSITGVVKCCFISPFSGWPTLALIFKSLLVERVINWFIQNS